MGNKVKDRVLPEHSLNKVAIKTKHSTDLELWELDRIDEPKKKVDKRRITQLKQNKYKERIITAKFKIIKRRK